MTTTQTGTRGVYRAEDEAKLPYLAYDADNHIYPPQDAEIRHLEKLYHERVFPTGKTHRTQVDVVGDEHKAKTLGEHPVGEHGGVNPLDIPEMEGPIPVPGAMLNKLNPLKNLDKESQIKLVQKFRGMEPAFENRERRIELMDAQGVHAAVIHAGSRSHANAIRQGDVTAGYAAARAWNRYRQQDWGFAYQNRIFTPAYIPLADIDLAVAELDRCMNEGAQLIGLDAGPSFGRSPVDPYFDPFWSRVNEAKLRVVIHLGASYESRGSEWSEDPNTAYKDFNGFQWLVYWSDFPIMETIAALVFQNFLVRFPNINVLCAEWGTPWLPYFVRKLDHAHLLGRKAKWGPEKLPMRPSELFKTRFMVAPFPEENVQRAIDVVGAECLVFGSDFPHSEGLPDPLQYVVQLKGQSEPVVKAIMRDNLARFLRA